MSVLLVYFNIKSFSHRSHIKQTTSYEGCQDLVCIWDAEIRRIIVQGQFWAEKYVRPSPQPTEAGCGGGVHLSSKAMWEA
jgi:hypothetical protein